MRAGPALAAMVLLVAANVAYAIAAPEVLQRVRAEHQFLFRESPSPTGPIAAHFTPVTASGIDYRRAPWQDVPPYPAVITGGLAAADVDGDGLIDLYFPPGGPGQGARLYRNAGNLTFTDGTGPAGLQLDGYGAGATFGDIDNDGDPDLFVAVGAGGRLYRNDGGSPARFTDVTARSGIDFGMLCTPSPCQPSSVVWTDVDRDGRLDLFGVNNLDWTDPNLHSSGASYSSLVTFGRGQPPFLFHNEGDGTFHHVLLPADRQKGLGAAAADLDGDGDPDLLTANDLNPNAVLVNQGDGTFRNAAQGLGALQADCSSMGIQAADVTGDGRPDIVLTDLRSESMSLLVQRPDGTFDAERPGCALTPAGRGLQGTGNVTGWGVQVFDADLDGWPDIGQASGRAAPLGSHANDIPNQIFPELSRDTQDMLFRNVGEGQFVDVTAYSGFGDQGITRGLLAADLDDDGDLDVVRVQLDGQGVEVLRNDVAGQPGWLAVELHGVQAPREGIGARVEVRPLADDGVHVPDQVQEMVSAAGFQTGMPARLQFGLGPAVRAHVFVHWPSGALQDAGILSTGRHVIAEPAMVAPAEGS